MDLLGGIVTHGERNVPHGEDLGGKLFSAHRAQQAASGTGVRERKSCPGPRSAQRRERLRDPRRLPGFAMGRITVLWALAFSLTLVLASFPVAARDFATFVKVSNDEKVLEAKACGKYGGREISEGEYELVMNSGRTDDSLYNVIHYGGFQYVTFKVDASNSITRLFGFKNHKIGLCQF
jgi:hypothetical protein